MSALKYWLWLTTRPSLRPGEAAALADRFGSPEGVYFADPEEYRLAGLPLPLRKELSHKELDYAQRVQADCARLGIRILTMQDAEYPERLRQIDAPPAVLYVKGKHIAFDEEVAIGVVGSRRASEYGLSQAGTLGWELARGGALVVSGIAQGVDSACLRSAIRAGGTVCSVLGGGIDRVYPFSSADLYERIPEVGALISEYPPGTPTEGHHFPVRNRIISGLSLGVVAVEAAERSGTLITARKALDQNRDVFAFPGPAGAPSSAGTNLLIQRGEAKLVLSARDVLEEYETLYPAKVGRDRSGGLLYRAARKVEKPVEKTPKMPRKEEKIPLETVDKGTGRSYSTFEACTEEFTDDEKELLLKLGESTLRPDDLVEATGIPARRILSALTMLQVRGYVEEKPGNGFAAVTVFTA
ncbi:DNA-processing protein DprA [Pseudoflavonifractor sp. HCP28S3_F10]|uniref:DNA-processing protein DprA n=1 Tax=Pseudoflavonifractor sp. HCP28S3_F10 TaxID=3438947 RepID=UPI003F8861C9